MILQLCKQYMLSIAFAAILHMESIATFRSMFPLLLLSLLHITTCNTLRGQIKGNFCATNLILHTWPLLWNAVTSCQHTWQCDIWTAKCADNSLLHSKKLNKFPKRFDKQGETTALYIGTRIRYRLWVLVL